MKLPTLKNFTIENSHGLHNNLLSRFWLAQYFFGFMFFVKGLDENIDRHQIKSSRRQWLVDILFASSIVNTLTQQLVGLFIFE